jgi:hypothetical protein
VLIGVRNIVRVVKHGVYDYTLQVPPTPRILDGSSKHGIVMFIVAVSS